MNIRNVFLVAKKDLLENSGNLFAPIAMTIALFFLMFSFVSAVYTFLNIIPFILQFPTFASQFDINDKIINPYIGFLAFLSIIIAPIVGAKAFSQEKKLKTIELLLTYPFTELELVLGKVISSFLIYLVFLVFGLLYLFVFIFFYNFMNKGFIDFGSIWSGFLGLFLLSLAVTSFSVFVSALFEEVISSLSVSIIGLIFLWIVNIWGETTNVNIKNIIDAISLASNFENFSKGVIDLKNVAFFVFFSFLFIYLTTKILSYRK